MPVLVLVVLLSFVVMSMISRPWPIRGTFSPRKSCSCLLRSIGDSKSSYYL